MSALRSVLILMAAVAVGIVLTLSCGKTSADDAGKAPSETSPPAYVPVKFDEKEAKKQQSGWAAKLKVTAETMTPSGIAMVLIPSAGEALPNPYWIGKFEVTQGEWAAVMGSNPSGHKAGNKVVDGLDTSRHPVEAVTWFESLEFCNRLSEKEKLKPYYKIDVIERDRENKQIIKAELKILGGEGYHLPTYPEWEHTCRAGAITQYHWGEMAEDMEEFGWFDKNSDNRTHAVGEKKPNAFGLHDMHGNVREWIQDFRLDEKTTKIASHGSACGGSFQYKAEGCQVNGPRWHGTNDAISFVGLRLARAAKVPASDYSASIRTAL